MLNLRCIHSSDSDSESDSGIEIDPEVLKEIKKQQKGDDYLFELEVNSLETSNKEENTEYLCEINTVTTAPSDIDESEPPVFTLKDELLGRLFLSDNKIDLSWISKIRDGFESMEPDEQHDVSYSLVTRLLSALEYFVNLSNQHSQNVQNQNTIQYQASNKEERHVSFEEGIKLLEDSDDADNHNSQNLLESDESESDDDNNAVNDQDYEMITTPPTNIERPTPTYFNNSRRRFEYHIPLDIDDEDDEEQKKAIRRLSRRARKWKRLARDRLQEIQRDIEFRDRLIEALLQNQKEEGESIPKVPN